MDAELEINSMTDKMILSHETEINRVGAKIWNHGWVGGNDHWISKTSHGLLETKISNIGEITHKWVCEFDAMSEKGKIDWLVNALVYAVIEPSDKKSQQIVKKIQDCCASGLNVAQVQKCKKKAKNILAMLEAV